MDRDIKVIEVSNKYFTYKIKYLIFEGENISTIYGTVNKLVEPFLNTIMTKLEHDKLVERISIDSGLDVDYVEKNFFEILFAQMVTKEYTPSIRDLKNTRVYPLSDIHFNIGLIDECRIRLERESNINDILST